MVHLALLLAAFSLTFATTAALPSGHLVPPSQVGMAADRLIYLDEVLQKAVADGDIPGGVALVARYGKTVYRKAFGLRVAPPHAEKMTVDTIFDVASLTKVMATAPAIMVLVEEGKVALTDPVGQYLPKFSSGGNKDAVTVGHLLTHYSGLRPYFDLEEQWQGYEMGIRKAEQEEPVVPPGQHFIYSDINYILLAEIVREISGQFLDTFATERIFRPLGMHDTRFLPDSSQRHRLAPTEDQEGTMLRGQVHDPTAQKMGGRAGHAGLFSTVDDTAAYTQMILNGGTHRSARILSPLTVLAMTTPQSPPGKPDWRGLGFDIRSPFGTSRGDLFPVGSFGHTGFTGTSFWIDPFSQTVVILFTNRLHPDGQGNVVSLRKRVASVVASSLIEAPIDRKALIDQH